ncbi:MULTISPECIES: filamentous hemagglutinin family protein [unclassified Variovorax]|uniref:filamentous hemagglutinin family protein n=1 Tax=unclassified Variovorax TaxID=663243 RepID=UPI002575DF5B|nr:MULTISPECIES: filamentous hemagglutinin family protein [unclassified Variovorax]MDM0089992.1 filamentous hemagglutinin family protein [Variovorax sp. J22G40]MDM0148342.1 filamentous hemagglutinin family protein [Variovorax sp. J2P1-31]
MKPATPVPARSDRRVRRMKPLVRALTVMLAAGGAMHAAQAQRAFSPAWMAQKNVAQNTAAATGRLPNGQPVSMLTNPLAQQQAANAQLARSIDNLNLAARGIAAQQAAQAAARAAALAVASSVPDGLGEGGLKVDTNSLTAGWLNANAPTQATADGKTTVAIQQTADKAILNWESFNVGRNTTVEFKQQADWAVLNRVNDPNARPSQIQGQVKGDGTVLIANRNGIVFSGTSQVDTRNLVAAAAHLDDAGFKANGIYAAGNTPNFKDALGQVEVQAGARITTPAPKTATQGGGYVLLMGSEVRNAGAIATPGGQALLAAGDGFTIRKGVGTDGNQASTTRGNEALVTLNAGSTAGKVVNTGLIAATTGDVTLTGREVHQDGVVVSSTTVNTRGTVHLGALGAAGAVTLGAGSTTAILLDTGGASALDSQRAVLVTPVVDGGGNIIDAGNDRRDLSRVEITSGGTVDFARDSLTLATGGQVVVNAAKRSLVRDGAVIDVAGAVGVQLTMESNNVKINVQGNEQRDAPVNRDGKALNSNDVWIDRRSLVFVPKGTNGYENDRWYTAGGLLEVGGYLGTQGHTVGEWMAQGGVVNFGGAEVVTQAGSAINLSGGTLDVQTGKLNQSWLKGADGRLYELNKAPGDLRYTGLYKGFEDTHERWGDKATEYFHSPLIAARQRLENGYTVGRDAGLLVVGTRSAVLEGGIVGDTYQGPRQTQAPNAALDGYNQSQKAVARGAQLVVGSYAALYDKSTGLMHRRLDAVGAKDVVLGDTAERIAAGLDLTAALPAARQGTLYLDTTLLNGFALGAVRIAATGSITVEAELTLGNGGDLTLYGPQVAVNANLTAHGGRIRLGNTLTQASTNYIDDTTSLGAAAGLRAGVAVTQGVTLDTRGLWSNLWRDPADTHAMAWRDGGSVSIRSSGDLRLAEGSAIDVSSGAALLADGKAQQGGKGGDIRLQANAGGGSTDGVLAIEGVLRGGGTTGGGTLSLETSRVRIGGSADVAEPGTLVLAGSFFDKGFGRYELVGDGGLTVAEGTQVEVTMPVLRVTPEAKKLATGADAGAALQAWTPPLYTEDAAKGVLKQRAGASLSLQAGTAQTLAADLPNVSALIGQGARIAVDPGQSIQVLSVGQLTLQGTLQAHGGSIALKSLDLTRLEQERAVDVAHSRSIWIAEQAVVDVSATPATALDAQGRRYGIVRDGGSIVVGGEIKESDGSATAANGFIVVREGALLDASGTAAVLDLGDAGPVAVASRGGRIALATNNGLYLNGELRAHAGGAGAAGGALQVALESPEVRTSAGVPGYTLAENGVRGHRELVIGGLQGPSDLPAVLAPGAADAALVYGHGRLGVDTLARGGFDTLALFTAGSISLEDNASLRLGQSLSIYGALVLAAGARSDARITLEAPYVRLAGITQSSSQDVTRGRIGVVDTGGWLPSKAQLEVRAGLIDVRSQYAMSSIHGSVPLRPTAGTPTPTGPLIERLGFDHLTLVSEGDLRFLSDKPPSPNGAPVSGISTPGDLTLRAAQIYPATGVSASIYAGVLPNSRYAPDRVLRIERQGDATPGVPYAVFGQLILGAATIEQGGVLRVPLGYLRVGDGNTQRVDFLPGSLTSVSGNGLLMPYGGTVDGLNYLYDGKKVELTGVGGTDTRGQTLVAGLTLGGASANVQAGAVLDLSGGGDLTGTGFIGGRGGSTDARYHPLVRNAADGSFSLPGLGTNPVYAIVPGVQAPQAPVAGERGAVDPLVGQQITLGAGVPGLPAGTYTLMPSTYALLPGAFRVELNGSAAKQAAAMASSPLRNGSWSAAAQLSVARTAIGDTLFRQAILTPAAVLRTFSQYDETSFNQFILSDAARQGVPRAMAPADARTLLLNFVPGAGKASLQFDGIGRFDAAQGGYGGTVAAIGGSSSGQIEIVGAGAAATPGFTGVTLSADALNRMGASRLMLGGLQYVTYGPGGRIVMFNSGASELTLRQGALLSAPEVFLLADAANAAIPSHLVIEQGAGIHTLGKGRAAYDSADGFVYAGSAGSLVAVSNGVLTMLPVPASVDTYGNRSLQVGACTVSPCVGVTELYSEGTIALSTPDRFVLDDTVRYGTRNLTLAVQGINVGDSAALADAAARQVLPSGLALNQGVLDRLLRGDTRYGAPALETLELNASGGMRFFGSASLDTIDPATGKSSLARLVLGTPAIYGAGDANDVATIRTQHLIWKGAPDAPATAVTGGAGTGSGTLAIEAARIEFGYGPGTQPTGTSDDARLALGFADVRLTASDRITSNHKGSLSVYQSQGAYDAATGYAYSGGNLTIDAPLVTGEAGSIQRITAGGDLRVTRTAPAIASAADAALGAELRLAGRDVRIDSTLALPTGKLVITAQNELTLTGRAQLDLAGRKIDFNDVSKYSWGGDLTLESLAGNVRQAEGSVIDLSAQNNRAGTLKVVALGAQAGVVDLQGTLRGTGSGHYDAGGTRVPYLAGAVEIRAQRLGDAGTLDSQFASLNQRLNEGGVFGARTFQLKQGDLTIGDGLKAGEINVSVDNGSLTVTGTVDASGARVGQIHLAAKNALTLTGTAMLDAHGTLLRVDSYGKIIDSPNRAIVDLSTREGVLTLADGARIDLRHGTSAVTGTAAGQNDGRARGTLELSAPRLGANGLPNTPDAAVYGDIAIDARGALDIRGARSIAVNGMQRYDDAPLIATPAASGRPYQEITQAWLDGRHAENTKFVDAALARDSLVSPVNGKLAGLRSAAYADALHLRPGVEIVSNAVTNPGGDLVVSGDLDLSGYRYASLNPHTQQTGVYGSGEVGTLRIRAAGNLDIFGSINDGFAPPPATPDDKGWLLLPGVSFYGGDTVIPRAGVVLGDGTAFEGGTALNFDLPIQSRAFGAGMVIPVTSELAAPMLLSAGTVLAANVRDASGRILHAAGSIVGETVTLPQGTRLDAGMRLPTNATLAAMVWPRGVLLPGVGTRYVMNGNTLLPVGALLPAATNIKLPGDATSVDLRPDGTGRLWGAAAMLPEGSQSWSLQLVAGADLGAADARTLQQHPLAGDLRLADTHYGLFAKALPFKGSFAWTQQAADDLGLEAGAKITDEIAQQLSEGAYQTAAALCADNPSYCAPISAYTWTQAAVDEIGLPEIVAGKPIDDQWLRDATGDPTQSAANYCSASPSHCASSAVTEYEHLPGSIRFSVLRTGAADLELRAAGDLAMKSLYGVYTAGTSSQATQAGDPYNLPRAVGSKGTVLIDGNEGYEKLVDGGADSLARAWYPSGGGNLTLQAGGNLTGDLVQALTVYGMGRPRTEDGGVTSPDTANWLWRQGSGHTLGEGSDQPTAWWINFGSYATRKDADALVGFTGFGTLGGGDLRVDVGGDAGIVAKRGAAVRNEGNNRRSEGLVLAVGGTGRVLADGSLTLTGGGDLRLRVGGALNPFALESLNDIQANGLLNGTIVNLRGDVQLQTGAIGTQSLRYSQYVSLLSERDSRALDPFAAGRAVAQGGIVLVPGDANYQLNTRGDLVVVGANDAGRAVLQNPTPFTSAAGAGSGEGWFTLWTPHTAIRLFSAGGDLTPQMANAGTPDTDMGNVYPSILSAVAASGSLYYGSMATANTTAAGGALVLAPSSNSLLEFLATESIYGGGFTVSPSGAVDSAMATPFHPAFQGTLAAGTAVSNLARAGNRVLNGRPLFALGANTVSAGSEHGSEPVRFYAVNGDLVGVATGRINVFEANDPTRAGQTYYEGGQPVWMMAGRDIVGSGTPIGQGIGIGSSFYTAYTTSGNLFTHSDASDVSVVAAGRDILYSNFGIAGPGTLEITAGRHIQMEDRAGVTSLGPVVPGDRRPGARIAMLAGVGAQGPDYSGFLARYLGTANRAQAGLPLADQPGKVVKTYDAEMLAWLADPDNGLGFTGTGTEAQAFFDALPPQQQRIFARQVYFAELQAGGREYNDGDSTRFGSYLRGRNAIAALFPETAANGQPIDYRGDITVFRGTRTTVADGVSTTIVRSGFVRTLFGGDIQLLTPGGRQVFGVEGEAPPASSGVLTQGAGDIAIYSLGSILLGQSRIMTTFGGGILGWSAEGDINAGRGSKTTVVYTPPKRVYDSWGNVTLSSDVPSTGAGIATLAPIAEVPAGDIDLIAPLGTIDAGEAGIRVSGNVNLAALQVVNAANIQVKGQSVGIPTVAAVNVGALSNASAAASQAAGAAQEVLQRERMASRQALPSVFTVRVLGFGTEALPSEPADTGARPAPGGLQRAVRYDPDSAFQLLGQGALDPAQRARLTEAEQRRLPR